jgi:hypothetical protein
MSSCDLMDRLRQIEQQRNDRESEIRLLQGTCDFYESVANAMEAPSSDLKQTVLQPVSIALS